MLTDSSCFAIYICQSEIQQGVLPPIGKLPNTGEDILSADLYRAFSLQLNSLIEIQIATGWEQGWFLMITFMDDIGPI